MEQGKGGLVMVVPKNIGDALDRGEATIGDIHALLEVEAKTQGWSLKEALAWARSDVPAENYIQADIKALASLVELCCAA
jgi:hypothetical protein